MRQEQRDLLLKDLCARLPYGIKCSYKNKNIYSLTGIDLKKYIYIFITHNDELQICEPEIENIKPYLFPMSSITDKQREDYHNLCSIGTDECGDIIYFNTYESIDYLNKNKFDYRYLIPMGLANDATNLNIY